MIITDDVTKFQKNLASVSTLAQQNLWTIPIYLFRRIPDILWNRTIRIFSGGNLTIGFPEAGSLELFLQFKSKQDSQYPPLRCYVDVEGGACGF